MLQDREGVDHPVAHLGDIGPVVPFGEDVVAAVVEVVANVRREARAEGNDGCRLGDEPFGRIPAFHDVLIDEIRRVQGGVRGMKVRVCAPVETA